MNNENPRSTLAILLSLVISATSLAASPKPRIIVLTDISPATVEPDDMESIIRLFACADLFEIEGLVATTGWSSGGNNAGWIRLIHDAINAYEKDLPNLQKRSGQKGHLADESSQAIGYWPSPGYLRSVTVVGSQKRGMSFIGKANHSPGSDLIIKATDEKDERPVWVLAWGGGNTLAQAIWRVQEERTPNQPGTPAHSVSRKYETRFYPAIFNDFAARMDWAKDGSGNRNPIVIVNGDSGPGIVKLTVAQGDSVTLDASATRDPDGDKLKFSWWVLTEAGTCPGGVVISGGDSSRATIKVPSDAAGKDFHVICEVTDDGVHNLASYRRIIFETKN